MKYLVAPLILSATFFAAAQQHKKDSLLQLLSTAKEDTLKVNIIKELGIYYENYSSYDSALMTYHQGLELANRIKYRNGKTELQFLIGFCAWRFGDFPTAIKIGYSLLENAKQEKDTSLIVSSYAILFNSYRDQGDYNEALELALEGLHLSIRPKGDKCDFCGVATASIGSIYYWKENYDSALFYLNKSLTYHKDFSYGWILLMTGRTFDKLASSKLALDYLYRSIDALSDEENFKDLAGAYMSISNLFVRINQTDSAIHYGKLALRIARKKSFNKELLETYLTLSSIYKKIDSDTALAYLQSAMAINNTIYNQDKQRQITSHKFNELLRKNEIEAAALDYQNQIRTNALLGITFTLVVIAIFLFRNTRVKQKAKHRIEQAYDRLKSTQSQLIQSEKMASLGELTAGIAHEIQNPLNFVNNFSEVSTELIDEMKSELATGNVQLATEISNDLKQNLEKINHHGKRAADIVKGMLQHSRSSLGVKEPTGINALADEYLRLAYHGLRAKDKSFNAKFETNFDLALPKANVIPQDIGRVILNLITNAFYVVNERTKNQQPATKNEPYTPTVIVSTKKVGNAVEIRVKDNGNGIPDSIKEKIFQPFFTTKPTGQGTGLGLSLSYDIVKAHGGELKVETKEGEGSEFIIKLPIV